MRSPVPARTSPGSVPWPRRSGLLLVVLAGNMLLDALEVSVVIVALPSIGQAFDLSVWTVQWVMSGFALGFAALLLVGTRVVARFGRRRVYLGALLVFALASVVGGLAHHESLLIATRVVKGLCAALTAPTGLAIIVTAFREGRERSRAVSVYSFCGAVGFTTGVLLSGVFTQFSWRWTVLFAAPVALLLLVAAARVLPSTDGPVPRGSVPLRRLLRNGPLVRSALGAAALNGTNLGLLFLVSFHLRSVLGWTSWQTALALLPACVPLALSALSSGRMVTRFGAPRLIALGALAPAVGCVLALGATTVPVRYATDLLPALALLGVGLVLAFAALNSQATSTISAEDRGAATALYQTAVQLGAVVVLTVVSLSLASRTEHGESSVSEVALTYRQPLVLVTAVAVAGLLVALTSLLTSTASTRTAHRSRP